MCALTVRCSTPTERDIYLCLTTDTKTHHMISEEALHTQFVMGQPGSRVHIDLQRGDTVLRLYSGPANNPTDIRRLSKELPESIQSSDTAAIECLKRARQFVLDRDRQGSDTSFNAFIVWSGSADSVTQAFMGEVAEELSHVVVPFSITFVGLDPSLAYSIDVFSPIGENVNSAASDYKLNIVFQKPYRK